MSSTSLMTSSDALDSLDACSSSASPAGPNNFVFGNFPAKPPSIAAFNPNTPSTSKQTTPESNSASPSKPMVPAENNSMEASPTHRRPLSGGLFKPGGTPMDLDALQDYSGPTTAGACDMTKCQGDRSHLVIEPRLQPLPPLNDSVESVSIYENHKLKSQLYYRQSREIELLLRRTRELDVLLQEAPAEKKPIAEKYQELSNEHMSLQQLEEILQKQLSDLRSRHSTDESWVFVEMGQT